jgi:hypothetical protein
MSVRVQTEECLAPGSAEAVLEGRDFAPAGVGRNYDISPDGKRFLTIREPSGETARAELNLVLNWFEELERLVPTEP